MYLLDTNIISATAPTKRDRPEALIEWIERADRFLYLSVVSASEIFAGITKKEREGAVRRAGEMRQWWRAIEDLYGARILPLDIGSAIEAGQMVDRFRAFDPGYEDIAIAATAMVHGLTVLTANERHFAPLGVPVVNPFVALPRLPDDS